MRARVLAFLLLLAAPRLESADLPASPAGVVLDSARLFTEADRAKLEAFGADVLRERGVALRVLTLLDAKGEDQKAIAVRALNQWRVGPKSVLLLIVMNPRSLYLQPGTALASTFDAATSSRICSSVVAPQMRAKASGAAALAGFGAIRDRLAQPSAPRAVLPSPRQPDKVAAAPEPGPGSGDAFAFAVKTFHLDVVFGLVFAAFPLYWILSKVFARKCPDCRTRMARVSRVTEAPTFAAAGLGEYTFTCGSCGHVEAEAYLIGKRQFGMDPDSSSSDTGVRDTTYDSTSSSSSSSSSSDSGSSSDGSGGGGSSF